jgi:hypothetical protein
MRTSHYDANGKLTGWTEEASHSIGDCSGECSSALFIAAIVVVVWKVSTHDP